MSIIGLSFALVMLVLLLAFTVSPLMMRQVNRSGTFRSKQRERALAYYERVLRNIRDLDDDLATGKIAQEEYDVERERWMNRGVQLLQMLEQLDQKHDIDEHLDHNANDAEIDAAIEQAIQQTTANEIS